MDSPLCSLNEFGIATLLLPWLLHLEINGRLYLHAHDRLAGSTHVHGDAADLDETCNK